MFSFLYTLTHALLPGRRPISYGFCSGLKQHEIIDGIRVNGHFELISVIVHFTIRWKIHKYKNQERQNVSLKKDLVLRDLKLSNFYDSSVTLSLIFFLFLGTFYVNWVNTRDPKFLAKYPNYLHMYIINLIGPTAISIFLLVITYKKSQPMKTFLLQEINNNI